MKLSQITSTLSELAIQPTRSLGQNFLHDQNLAEWRQGWSYAGHLRPGYMEELVAFARAIRDGFPASASLDDGAAALRVCVAILESARTRRSVAPARL